MIFAVVSNNISLVLPHFNLIKFMNKISYALLCISIMASSATAQDKEARLMRFPTIYNNQVVFSYAGDLYTVDKSGGQARKLTSDIGYEMFARFSSDGKNIAFTGQYDGNTEVYLIPAEGGKPETAYLYCRHCTAMTLQTGWGLIIL